MYKLALSLFLLGCISASGPCLAACGPLLLSFGVGSGAGVRKSLAAYLIFSLSRIAAYLVLGLGVYLFGQAIFTRLSVSSVRFVVIGAGVFISIIGVMISCGCHPAFKKNVCAMGFIAGLIPCGPLIAILAYVGMVSHGLWQCLVLIFAYGAGTFVSPLAVLSGLSGIIPRWLRDRQPGAIRILNIVCGAIIILFGVRLMLSGYNNA